MTTRTFFLEDIKQPVSQIGVLGFPGWGNVGRGVLEKLIEISDAKQVANIISYYFADVMIADDDGFVSLPCLNAYRSRFEGPMMLLVSSAILMDALPSFAVYQVLEEVTRVIKAAGCKLLVSVESVGSHEERAFIIGNSKTIVKEYAERMGLEPLRSARLPGYSGILLSISRLLKLDAIAIIQSMSNPVPNPEVNTDIFRKLFNVLTSFISLD